MTSEFPSIYYAEPFYELITATIRTRLLRSTIDLKLPELFEQQDSIEKWTLIKTLKLDNIRGEKWLALLVNEQFLQQHEHVKKTFYSPGLLALQFWGELAACKYLLTMWDHVLQENVVDTLQGAPVKYDYNWPPRDPGLLQQLETSMSATSAEPIQAIEEIINFNPVRNMLDVGGGQGTVALYFAKKHPALNATIYNLPGAEALITEQIANGGLSERVSFMPGNFKSAKTFAGKYDLILFCRVLWDWSASTASKLLKMAYDALEPGGRVVICEGFKDHSPEFSLAWEYRYLFWDEFEAGCFKQSAEYRDILTSHGFDNISLVKSKSSCFAVLTAEKNEHLTRRSWFYPSTKTKSIP